MNANGYALMPLKYIDEVWTLYLEPISLGITFVA